MEVYREIYTPIFVGDAAMSTPTPIVASLLGQVIFWWKCVCFAGHISVDISFKFIIL